MQIRSKILTMLNQEINVSHLNKFTNKNILMLCTLNTAKHFKIHKSNI